MQPISTKPCPCSFFFISIIIFIADPTSVQSQFDRRYQDCRSTFECGKLEGIGYPFWGSNRPDYCGHPKFQLNCTGQTAVIKIEELNYQVLDINITSQTLKVARKDYMTSLCPDVLVNTTFDPTLFTYASDTQNITAYYDCSSNSTPGFNNQFTCSLNGSNSNGSFLTGGQSYHATITNYLSTCNNKVIVPATRSAVEAFEKSDLTQVDLLLALAEGFVLQWEANDTFCEICKSSGGLCGSISSNGSFVCYCTDQPHPFSCGEKNQMESGSKRILNFKLGVGLGTFTGAVTLCLGIYCCFTRIQKFHSGKIVKLWGKNKKEDEKIEKFIMNYESFMPKRFSYSDIQKMTNSFVHKLGQGGFGGVYKGKLPDGRLVAVKVLTKSTGTDGEEFINEVASISRTCHINIVSLLGFCYERTKRALIYEYMPNGSLDKFIYDQNLDWKKLYDIAVGTARGLEYLHRGCNTRIVHFDIKPHNILLDQDFCPKISDFGLAKLCKGKESIILSMLDARGTAGYIAPEVFLRKFGGVSYKSDVYSYGMMILEMFGGKNNADVGISHATEMNFPDSIHMYLESRKIPVLDENMTNEEEETVRKVIIVGFWCIQTNPSNRPTMTKVVEMLEGSLQSLPIPPKPCLFSTIKPEHSSAISSTPNIYSRSDEEKVLSLAEVDIATI